jgi:ribose 5-phosphate isomerase RpiB
MRIYLGFDDAFFKMQQVILNFIAKNKYQLFNFLYSQKNNASPENTTLSISSAILELSFYL